MENDRYAPPAAAVADVVPAGKGQPPSRVVLAVRLLWVSLLLAVPSFYFSVERSPAGAATAVTLVFELGIFALAAYLNVSIFRGKNWARILSLIFTALGLLLVAFAPNPVEITVIEQLVNGVATVLDVVAMYLLFTAPGSAWFKNVAR